MHWLQYTDRCGSDPALNYNANTYLAMPPQTTRYLMTATAPASVTCPAALDSIYVYVGNIGIDELHANTGISIAPNPFRESFQLKTSHDDKDEYILTLSPISGKELMTLRGSILQINRKLALAIKELAPGNYILHIQNKRSLQQATFKPVKIK